MSTYVYTPLSAERPEIRLLKLRASISTSRTGPLVGSLRTCRFPETDASRTRRLGQSLILPRYLALSYVWGAPDCSRELYLDNGLVLRITPSLDTALRDVRSTEMTDFYIWADAVCINQMDLVERSAQIRLMRQIYHTAGTVCIWLGPGTPESDPCLQYLQDLCAERDERFALDAEQMVRRTAERRLPRMGTRIAPVVQAPVAGFNSVYRGVWKGLDVINDVVSNYGKDPKAEAANNDEDECSSPISPLASSSLEHISKWEPTPAAIEKANETQRFNVLTKNLDTPGMARLIERIILTEPLWYTRIWCVQEHGVALNAEVVMGSKRVWWVGIAQALSWMSRTTPLSMHRWSGFTTLERINNRWNAGSRPLLYDLVRETRDKLSTDPRDKIYALLGLMGEPASPLLQPDYAKSVKDVYTLATLYLITAGKSFDILCGWNRHGRLESLPSWVPDFSLAQLDRMPPIDGEIGVEKGHDACRGRKPSFAGIERGNMTGSRKLISVQGVELPAVQESTSTGATGSPRGPGDKTCIILGCSLPVILRKAADVEGYTFIGDCFVPGYMNGEAIDLLDNGELKLQEFVLR